MNRLYYLIPGILLLVCTVLLSCKSGTSKSNQSEVVPDDSTEVEKKSIPKDPKEDVVYGEVKFGISREEYNRIVTRSTQQVGFYQYAFEPGFNQLNQLYQLSISGDKVEIWDSAMIKMGNLENKIFQYYPHCDYFNQTFTYMNLRPGFLLKSRKWVIGKKEIITGIYEEEQTMENNDYTKAYRPVCKIFSAPMVKNLGHEKDKEEDSMLIHAPGQF